MPNEQVKIGVSAKDLEEQGVTDEDARGFAPQIPDYLGYVLGFLIIWLVYTSYRSAVEKVREPIQKLSQQAEVLKEKVEIITTTPTPETTEVVVGQEVLVIEEEVPQKSWYARLEQLNRGISWAADYVSNQLLDVIPQEADEVDTTKETSPARGRLSRQESDIDSF